MIISMGTKGNIGKPLILRGLPSNETDRSLPIGAQEVLQQCLQAGADTNNDGCTWALN